MPSPFDLADHDSYRRWRDAKLAQAITRSEELIVEIADPLHVTPVESAALRDRCRRSNMALYATRVEMDETMLRAFGAQFGLIHLDANWLADKQGISRITVSNLDNQRQAYIPYTDRPIKWHTDGYYNPPQRQIRGMILHCVQSAGSGGENQLLDHEIAYLWLRDENPQYIHALSSPDVMTIPPRVDEFDGVREAETGPVFSVDTQGHLHMRYTARTRSIEWKDDEITRAAVKRLEQLLDAPSPHHHRLKMENGVGLLCNNVLHDRAAFTHDPAKPRLLFRARYLERVG